GRRGRSRVLHRPRRHVGVRAGRDPARHHQDSGGPRQPRVRRRGSEDAVPHGPDLRLHAPRQGGGPAASLVSGPVEVTAAPKPIPRHQGRTDLLLLVNAIMGQFVSGFGSRLFIVALPTIAATLNADILGISWALIAYQLAGISLSVVFG